jgi:hypothetical protein
MKRKVVLVTISLFSNYRLETICSINFPSRRGRMYMDKGEIEKKHVMVSA